MSAQIPLPTTEREQAEYSKVEEGARMREYPFSPNHAMNHSSLLLLLLLPLHGRRRPSLVAFMAT